METPFRALLSREASSELRRLETKYAARPGFAAWLPTPVTVQAAEEAAGQLLGQPSLTGLDAVRTKTRALALEMTGEISIRWPAWPQLLPWTGDSALTGDLGGVGAELFGSFCEIYAVNRTVFLRHTRRAVVAEHALALATVFSRSARRAPFATALYRDWSLQDERREQQVGARLEWTAWPVERRAAVALAVAECMLGEGAGGEYPDDPLQRMVAALKTASIPIWQTAAHAQTAATEARWIPEDAATPEFRRALARLRGVHRPIEPKGPVTVALSALGLGNFDPTSTAVADEIIDRVGQTPEGEPRLVAMVLQTWFTRFAGAVAKLGVLEGMRERLGPVHGSQLGAAVVQAFAFDYARLRERDVAMTDASAGVLWWSAVVRAWPAALMLGSWEKTAA